MIAAPDRVYNQVWYLESSERFRFMLILAVVLHALLILSLNFGLPEKSSKAQTLEVTLARFDDKEAPEQADYLAQTNQQGSGESLEKNQPSTQERALFDTNQPQQQAAMATQVNSPAAQLLPVQSTSQNQRDSLLNATDTPLGLRQLLTTSAQVKPNAQSQEQQEASAAAPAPAGVSTSLVARSNEIANLQARLMLEQQRMAKRPKVTRVTSASTLAHEDADYLDNWRQRIETLGNLNYPEEARQRSIHGSLRMLVALRPDGSIHEVSILKSSGHPTLDDAAIRIVQLAAPFQPFPLEMRQRTDLLEIIRTWKFEKGTHVY